MNFLSNYRTYIQYKLYHVDRFGINFKCGRGSGADIAFHFNPRVSQGSVVRNTMQNGQWQKEEKHGGMPFKKEKPFEIIFLVEESQFKVCVTMGRCVIRSGVLSCIHLTEETVSQWFLHFEAASSHCRTYILWYLQICCFTRTFGLTGCRVSATTIKKKPQLYPTQKYVLLYITCTWIYFNSYKCTVICFCCYFSYDLRV